jgi:hypothetical protein
MPSLKLAVGDPLPLGNRIVKISGEPVTDPPKVTPLLMFVRVKLVMVARPDPVEVTVTVMVRLAALPLQGAQVTVMVGVETVPGLFTRTAFPVAPTTAPVDPSTVKVLVIEPAATLPIAGTVELSIAILSAACAPVPNPTRTIDSVRRIMVGPKVMPRGYPTPRRP